MGPESLAEDSVDLHLKIDSNTKAVDCIAEHSDLSRARIKHVMQCGAVWRTPVDGMPVIRLRRASARLVEGEQLHMYYRPSIIDAQVSAPQCIADEGDYSIWFKPRGLLSQGSRYGDHHTVARQAEAVLKDDRPVLLVHRLDRFTSGLVLLAHSKKAQRVFSSLFASGNIDKRYRALVEGVIPAVDLPRILDWEVDNKPARSHCHLIRISEQQQRSVVEVRIETGRKHQVRAHLAQMGYPVVGDRQYGKKATIEELQLYATSLAFHCPLNDLSRHYQLPAELISGPDDGGNIFD